MVQGWRLLDKTSFSLFVLSVMPWLALDFSLVPSERPDSGAAFFRAHTPFHPSPTLLMWANPGKQAVLGLLLAPYTRLADALAEGGGEG